MLKKLNKLSPDKLNHLPFVLAVFVFLLHISFFQIYEKYEHFKAPLNLKLNLDTPAYGACAGDFPAKFISQTRCGQYNLMRPMYPLVLYVLSQPVIWVTHLVSDSTLDKMGVKREIIPFAAASFVGIPLNLLLVFLVLIGFNKIFINRHHAWVAQMLYISSYGLASYIAHPILEIPQHVLMVWGVVLFNAKYSKLNILALALGLTVKEAISVYMAGFLNLFKNKKLSWHYFLIPLPLILWLLWLNLFHKVEIKSHGVSHYGFGMWFLTVFSDLSTFINKFKEVLYNLIRSLAIAFLPTLFFGLWGIVKFFSQIPTLIKYNLILALIQLLAMGFMPPRIVFNFLFLPVTYAAVLVSVFYIKKLHQLTLATILISVVGLIMGLFNLSNFLDWK